MQDLIDAVRAHANANWGKDGWDFLVECWDDEDIARAVGNAKTPDCHRCLQAGRENDGRIPQRNTRHRRVVT
jgi:hypothetical protein